MLIGRGSYLTLIYREVNYIFKLHFVLDLVREGHARKPASYADHSKLPARPQRLRVVGYLVFRVIHFDNFGLRWTTFGSHDMVALTGASS